MGIMLLVFTPIPYVDASSSWALASKYRRALVGAGGMLVEIFVAALAFYVWLAAEPGAVRVAAYNALVIGGATTLLFNGNPLLRFDGYYILSDLFELPNLRMRSNRYLGYVLERHLLGSSDVRRPHTAPGEPGWFVSYSVAAFVYRLFVVAAILTWILDWNFVVGVALGIFAAVGWFGMPLFKIVKHLVSSPSLRRVRGRALTISGGLVCLLVVAIVLVPVPLRTRAEGVVWVPEEAFVRAGCEGFVARRRARLVGRARGPAHRAARSPARNQGRVRRGARARAGGALHGRASEEPGGGPDHPGSARPGAPGAGAGPRARSQLRDPRRCVRKLRGAAQ
jgi:putative peptide zinc metalloprotease protein